MAENTKIEWCDHTVNLWWGCTKVHAGCDHCYAETLSKRFGNDVWGNDKNRKAIRSAFSDLRKFQSKAAAQGVIKTVFVGSMMDIFEKAFPANFGIVSTGDIRKLFLSEIFLGAYNNLDFLLLTKRPSNINKMIGAFFTSPNVMYGTSIVDQATTDTLLPHLKNVPGRRFLSIEPQLGPINRINLTGIDWVIQGGESGPGRRPFDLAWARDMRDRCRAAGVPYFFKQIDKVRDKTEGIPADLQIREFPPHWDIAKTQDQK